MSGNSNLLPPSPSATSKARSASKVAKQQGGMVYWTYQRDVTTYLSDKIGAEESLRTPTIRLPEPVADRSRDILKISIPPELSGRGDVNLVRNYGLIFERPKYNKTTVNTLLQEIEKARATIGANYSDGTVSFVDRQVVVDAINMSIMFESRLAFDQKRNEDGRQTVHKTYEATCRIPVDFFFESIWARGENGQIVAHEPTWKLPKPLHPETLDTSLEPMVVRPDTIFAVQIRSAFFSLNKTLLACLNLVDHLPPNEWIWDSLDFAYLVVEYKRGHLAESAALAQLVMAMTSALCHLAHFGVTGIDNPVYGLCVCREVARIIVGWQVDGKTIIADVPAQLGNLAARGNRAFAFHLTSPFDCLRLGTTIRSLQQYSKELKRRAEENWTAMQESGSVPTSGWCTRA